MEKKLSTIRLRLVGGLGNQLYQFGFALVLMKKLGYEKLAIDCTDMKKYRENWGFLIPTVLDKHKLDKFIIFEKSWFLKSRFIKILNYCNLRFPGSYTDKYNSLDASNFWKGDVFVDGYFEQKEHLTNIKSELVSLLRDDLLIDIPANVLVINVRGGEYVRLGVSSSEDVDQYQDLIKAALSMIKDPVIHLVTDDVSFAKEVIGGICVIDYIHEPNPQENFSVLISSKYKVLSRSTFAKWAGFLSSDDSTIFQLQ